MIKEIFAIFLLIILIVILTGIIYFWICYSTHIYMNHKQNLPYDYVDFETFINVFNYYMDKYKDDPNIDIRYGFGGSPAIFMRMKNNYDNYFIYLHADIVQFENKCMIFYPWSWIKYCIWMKQFVNGKRVNGLWKNEIN